MFRYICAWLQALFGYVKVWLPAAMEDSPDDSAWLGAAPAMEEDPVTVSLGPIGPLFQQLRSVIASLQDSRRLKLKGLKAEIQILGRELEGFCIDLKDLSEAPEDKTGGIARCWMRQVRDLCYDTADYLDELMHFIHYSSGARRRRRRSRTRNFGGNRLGSKTFLISRRLTWLSLPKLKTLKRAPLIAKLSSLVARVEDADERRKRFNISPPKSIKHDHAEAADAMPQIPIEHDFHVYKLFMLLAFQDKKVKVVTIFGSAGAGKTALARTLYHQHRGRFQHRAFIRVSRDPDMRSLLIDMLSQIKAPLPDAFSDAQGLIGSIIKHLQGKRYLIIIDDLWSTSTWDIIVRALPDGDYCRIITTTQVEDVALACCSYELKRIYEITPLNDNQSGKSSEGMKEEINLVYNDLPPHLKTCLLYLNMYQEGYTIRKHELVKQWVAEGFIGSVQGQDREDTAGCYFNALISKGMIQSVETSHTGEVLSCTLHHMVLDLIRQKSMDENFVTIVNYFQTILGLPDKVRRLSVQLGGAKGANNITENMRISQVRSLLFSGFFKRVPSIADYVLLEVLILHIWSDQDRIFDLTTIGELYRLRYLKIECSTTVKLPGKIRRLRHLGSLQVDARLCNVPPDIVYLEKLLHLRLLSECILPPGVGRMTSLRTLGYFDLGHNSEGNVRDLGELENLQDLQLTCSTVQPAESLEMNMQLLGSVLKKLSSLQSVSLVPATGSSHVNTPVQDDAGISRMCISCDSLCIESPAPTHLERLELSPRCCIFYRLPNWIGKLIKLRILKIAVRELSKEATDILKGIPSLTVLSLYVQQISAERIVFGKGGFSVLTYFKFTCTVPWLKFEAGAMPNLEKLKLGFNAQIVDEGIAHIIIEHLSGLKEISAKIRCAGVDAGPVRCKAISNDPRNPSVQLMGGIYYGEDQGGESSVGPWVAPAAAAAAAGVCGYPPPGPDPAQSHNNYNISAGLISSTRPVIEQREAERTLSEQRLMAEKLLVSASTGAMGSLLEKLGTMLSDEYKMLKGVRGDIQFLKKELKTMHTFLLDMADVEDPPKQDEHHANVVRELSYDIEDKIDKFMVLINHDPSFKSDSFKELFTKSMEKIMKIKARHKMAKDVKDIKIQVAEVSERHKRYTMDPSLRPRNEKVDPRFQAMYKDAAELVGINGPTNVLVNWLSNQEGASTHRQPKVVSIVGSGGLGKTTLARQVYNKLGADYDCRAFVSISRNPNMTSILRSILYDISKRTASPGESTQQIIDQIRKFLQDKRYFIIIDDIWDKKYWYETLVYALVRNDCGSAIMTTTRNINVAKSCSASDGDLVYELQPLGVDHSKKLFFKRIFGCEEKCPPNLKEASDDILKKCGGLPLAINATSSLLASREEPKQEWWDRVRRSIHFAQGEHSDIDAMDYILSLSYFDLPLYLRSCLLYLTMFPEDYKIERQRLVHRWISEGLIHGGDEEDLVELGQKYFHQLVNRSLIQPVGIGYDGQAQCCRVHDIVLDFLIRRSAKENFSTLLSSNPKSDCRVRRTYLMGNEDQASVEKVDLSHARSLGAFGSDIKQLPSFGKSNALRVLDLCKCYGLGNQHVKDIVRLIQLRYLNISETMIRKLPREIGDLEYLETLNLHRNLQELPESVTRLKRLARLFVGEDAKFPDGIGNMTNLQELGIIDALKQSVKFLEELGKLTNLRHLMIRWVCTSESGEASDKEKALVSSLCKLDTCKLHNLSIELWLPKEDATFIGSSFFPGLRSLRQIRLGKGWITEWMLSLINLERLRLFSCGHEIKQQDVEMVGSIPTLLEFGATNRFVGSIIIREGFQRLQKFDICACTTELTFEAGALPNLQELLIRWVSFELFDSAELTFEAGALLNLKEFTLWIRLDKFESSGAGLDFGIQHLTSLDRLRVVIDCAGLQPTNLDMERAECVFKSMAEAHPNRPTLKMMKGANYFALHDDE